MLMIECRQCGHTDSLRGWIESNVKTGDQVKAGQKIVVLGHSGMTDIYHVHLEYSVEPYMSTNKGYDRDPSFLFQENGSFQQNQKITP